MGDSSDSCVLSCSTTFAEELSSYFDLNVNCYSCPLMLNLIDPFLTSLCALAVLKKGLLRMCGTFESKCMSSTTKSTGMRNSLILTGKFSAMPNRYRTD